MSLNQVKDKNSPVRRALRVLVVGDQKEAADAVIWLVRSWGHTGYSARANVEALQVADARHPDVVLLHMEGPLTDAFELTQQVRRNHLKNECFVVVYTKQADDSLRRQGTRSGIDLLLVKPVDPELLEILLLLECERVHRSRTVIEEGATKVHASLQIQRCSLWTNGPDTPRARRESKNEFEPVSADIFEDSYKMTTSFFKYFWRI